MHQKVIVNERVRDRPDRLHAEIMLLVGPGDCTAPLFDTTTIHAEAAADWALAGPQAPHAGSLVSVAAPPQGG